ncbi:Ubiquitin-like protein 7 [Bulinus truncatus]|nr:Ubiquitin-like protein 7 [Bulinus truncatus]
MYENKFFVFFLELLHSGKIDRFQVPISSLEDSVISLASEISKRIQTDNFDIIYCGQVLKPGNNLSNYSLQYQSTVYVVDKFISACSIDNPASASGITDKNDVTMAVQSALLNSEYRTIVERMLTDPDTVENIIAATPGLDKDPCVLAMLQEPELLAVMAHPTNMDSLLQLHPSFAQAAITVATAVNEEGAKLGHKVGASSLSYSLDQMSDDEDEVPQASRSRSNISGITASQLAAALQAATGSAAVGVSQPPSVAVIPSSSQSAPGPSTSGSITGDFFQQAMVHAQTASNDAALQQIRDMGISDENVARQALSATGGDIQAAIDLIFGDGFM